ncbi:aspartate-semialdehyde dehydrogenase [Lactobacillus sp. ESL0680]|uniref:aspartate-semialdehyde dehydrogenase n=1 Tax=Lactobacillus sp. ESL0680 TaxID=2983210 RepID=UPI0023F6FC54|nr:aspartate-semialdehyde dehydrogenase [Lactobacillus sp. ESL0680]WEV38497.1 aspartate-semialdehyde dehydrogenase [Lactobacillus sp. ESL0680]
MNGYNVAILGATGAVGSRLISQLAESNIPVKNLKLLASARSAGKVLKFKNESLTVEKTTPDSFKNVDLVLASAGGNVSQKFLPIAVQSGAVCVDNTSAFRMDPDVPLVIPEVNREALKKHHGIIANPNCSTIQMVIALAPIYHAFGLKQVIVSTYQAVSGAGQAAWNEMLRQAQQRLNNEAMTAKITPVKGEPHHYPLAFNLLPQIDVFEDNGYTHEEWKMIHETKKILLDDMDSPDIKVTATCVRVPVELGHGESVYIEVADKKATVADLRQQLMKMPGIIVQDKPAEQLYPQPLTAAGKRETFVGRLRADEENPGAFNLWIVSDNLLKGAAWNTVEIAECLVEDGLI